VEREKETAWVAVARGVGIGCRCEWVVDRVRRWDDDAYTNGVRRDTVSTADRDRIANVDARPNVLGRDVDSTSAGAYTDTYTIA
jgi:hypothetical protein